MSSRVAGLLMGSPRGTAAEEPPAGRGFLAFARAGFRIGKRHVPAPRGVGIAASLAFLGAAGLAGWHVGGHHEAMKQSQGGIRDIAARIAGFPVRVVDISGTKELSKEEVLAASGLGPAHSLLFSDLGEVRARVKALPLVAEATVRKLYPDRVNITIVEREPFALWQHEGVVKVVSVDGTVIDSLSDQRYLRLPHVVGPGAQLRVKEYNEILEGVPEFRAQVRAGVLVSERRWTLKLQNGIDVKLPEQGHIEALRRLARLDRDSQVLSKDILAVDLRAP
ncbi:MAG: cell division protein FtsQ/DivIB, partial [Beijerinckiaceae bacterium]